MGTSEYTTKRRKKIIFRFRHNKLHKARYFMNEMIKQETSTLYSFYSTPRSRFIQILTNQFIQEIKGNSARIISLQRIGKACVSIVWSRWCSYWSWWKACTKGLVVMQLRERKSERSNSQRVVEAERVLRRFGRVKKPNNWKGKRAKEFRSCAP